MIPGVEPAGPSDLTDGVIGLTLGVAIARQKLLDGRHEEAKGNVGDAVHCFETALSLLAEDGGDSPMARVTRAAVLAGLARAGDEARLDAAAQAFESVPDDLLDGADLADRASLLKPDDPAAYTLYSTAVHRGSAPALPYAVLGRAALDADDIETALGHLWRAVLCRPLDGDLYRVCGDALRRAGQGPSAAGTFTAAAALMALSSNSTGARSLAQEATMCDPGHAPSQVLLGDLLRADSEFDLALERLASAASEAPAGSPLATTATRGCARALAATGRARAALDTLAPLIQGDDVSADDRLFAAELETTLGDDAAATAQYEGALATAPDRLDVLDAVLSHHLRQGRLDEAQRVVRDAIEWSVRHRAVRPELHVVLGELRSRAGEGDAPAADVERARLTGMEPVVAWRLIGEIRASDGNLAGTLQALGTALGLAPEASSLHARFGEVALQAGNVDAAMPALERATKLAPDDPNVLLLLADARSRMGDPRGARAAIDTALALVPQHPILVALRGRVERQRGEYRAAADDLERSVRLDPSVGWPAAELLSLWSERRGEELAARDIVDLLVQDGNAAPLELAVRELLDAGDTSGTVAVTSAFLATDRCRSARPQQLAALLVLRARALAERDQLAEAKEDLRHALELDPNYARARIQLAIVLASNDRPDEAAAEARRARRLDLGSADVASLCVQVIWQVEGDQRALVEVDEAIGHIGVAPGLLHLRARLLLAAARPKEALEVAGQLRRRWPGWDTSRTEGLSYAQLNDMDEAVPRLEAVVAADASDLEAVTELARCLINQNRAEDAVRLLEDVDLRDPAALTASSYRGVALATTGRWTEAVDTFRAILDVDEDYYWARIELVQAAWDLGDAELAKRHLQVLVDTEEAQDSTEVARLIWLLGDADTALARLDSILARNEQEAVAWMLRGAILVERQDCDAAIDAAKEALAIDPEFTTASGVLADALLELERPHDALIVLGANADPVLDPKRVSALFMLEQDEQALAMIDQMLARSTTARDASTLHIQVVDLLTGWDHHDRAVEVLDQALGAAPGPSLLRAVGALLSSIGEFEHAARVLEATRASRPQDEEVDSELAWAYANLDEPPLDEVVAATDRALRWRPEDPFLLKGKADGLLLQGREEEARRLYAHVLQDRLQAVPSIRQRHSLAGWCCYRSGDLERAVDHLIRATAIETPRVNGDRFDLGLVLLAVRRCKLALEQYRRAFEELRAASNALRMHGLARVALVDIEEGIRIGVVQPVPEALEVRALLRSELNACRPAFDRISGFLSRAAAAGRSPAG